MVSLTEGILDDRCNNGSEGVTHEDRGNAADSRSPGMA